MIAGSSHSESAAAGQRGHKQEELGLLPARASSNSAKTPEDHFGHVRGTSLKDMTAYPVSYTHLTLPTNREV